MNDHTRRLTAFPFPCFGSADWETGVAAQLRNESCESGTDGLVLLVAAPHGYSTQLLVHSHGSTATWYASSEVTPEISQRDVSLSLDHAQMLSGVAGRWKNRAVTATGPFDDTRGRVVTLFVASAGEVRWMKFQQCLGAPSDELDRLVDSVLSLPQCDVV